MALADIDIAIRCEGEHQRLPQQPLPLGFIPVSPVSLYADGHEELTFGTELHYRGAVRVADPDIVLPVDCHAVRLLMVADHVIADLEDKLVIWVELKQLWASGGFALKDPKISFRIEGNGWNTALTRRQDVWIREGVTQILLPLYALQCRARGAKPIAAKGRVTARRRGARSRKCGKRGLALPRKLVRILHEAIARPKTGLAGTVFADIVGARGH